MDTAAIATQQKKKRVKSKYARGFDEIAPSPGLLANYVIGTMVSRGVRTLYVLEASFFQYRSLESR